MQTMLRWRYSSLLVVAAGLQMGGCPLYYDPAPVPGVRVQTSLGDFTFKLNTETAPDTVANFLELVDAGYFTGSALQQVTPGQSFLAGGYVFEPALKPTRDPIVNESSNGRSNVRGTIAMARQDDPDSAAAQFYINLADNTVLDATVDQVGYTVFGQVVSGLAVADSIAGAPTVAQGEFTNLPADDVVIESISRTDPLIDPDKPAVRLVTNFGEMVVELDPVAAPVTVANFLQYVDEGFYGDTLFHRVEPGFVIQGGGYTNVLTPQSRALLPILETGAGAPTAGTVALGYDVDNTDEPVALRVQVGDAGTAQSADRLRYAVFGEIVDGQDVVAALAGVATTDRDGLSSAPVDDIRIEAVTVEAVPGGELQLNSLGLWQQYQTQTDARNILVDLINWGFSAAL